ncbi:Protein kinase superfamily protein [Perilla frutescens var. frutescens]|nr:Protein kinase superfamily protein [Perilla frutescens var. frutescens]
MEYVENDVRSLLETMKQAFSESQVKCLMQQLLQGVEYLHANKVLHPDLKSSNLLLNNCGELKICDFGLACRLQSSRDSKLHTETVITLWYRAPELLLNAKEYSTPIDIWSVGCIMAELLSKQPLFDGRTETDQLGKIFKILGTPNDRTWPGGVKAKGGGGGVLKVHNNCGGGGGILRQSFPAMSFTGGPVLSNAGFDLLTKLLNYNPQNRITAKEALNHPWFHQLPLPNSKHCMPTFTPSYA